MPSRIALFSSIVLLAAACGPQSETNEHQQPLITGCAGLDRTSCLADPSCELAELACIAVCVDPGDGGCESACPETAICQTRQVNPVACEALDVTTCGNRSDCEVLTAVCTAICEDDGHGGCLPCNAPSVCVTRQVAPVTCESLDVTTCGSRNDCEVLTAVCTAICEDDGHGGCLPCNAPSVCVTRQVNPLNCYGFDPNTCDQHPECEFVSRPCGDCPDNAMCFCSTEPSCQPREEPTQCAAVSDENTCNATPGCEFVLRDCDCSDALCDCPGVATCQPVVPQPPIACYGLDPNTCDQHPECEFYASVCNCVDALCDCPIIEPSCQPRRSHCEGLDLATCSADPSCEVLEFACDQACIDDGNGGCRPCEMPPSVCIDRHDEPVVGCGGGGSQPPSP